MPPRLKLPIPPLRNPGKFRPLHEGRPGEAPPDVKALVRALEPPPNPPVKPMPSHPVVDSSAPPLPEEAMLRALLGEDPAGVPEGWLQNRRWDQR